MNNKSLRVSVGLFSYPQFYKWLAANKEGGLHVAHGIKTIAATAAAIRSLISIH